MIFMSSYLQRQDGVIIRTFGGQMLSRVQCLTCGHHKETFDTYTQITLPLQTADSISFEYYLVTDSISSFFPPDTLTNDSSDTFGLLYYSVCRIKYLMIKIFPL